MVQIMFLSKWVMAVGEPAVNLPGCIPGKKLTNGEEWRIKYGTNLNEVPMFYIFEDSERKLRGRYLCIWNTKAQTSHRTGSVFFRLIHRLINIKSRRTWLPQPMRVTSLPSLTTSASPKKNRQNRLKENRHFFNKKTCWILMGSGVWGTIITWFTIPVNELVVDFLHVTIGWLWWTPMIRVMEYVSHLFETSESHVPLKFRLFLREWLKSKTLSGNHQQSTKNEQKHHATTLYHRNVSWKLFIPKTI